MIWLLNPLKMCPSFVCSSALNVAHPEPFRGSHAGWGGGFESWHTPLTTLRKQDNSTVWWTCHQKPRPMQGRNTSEMAVKMWKCWYIISTLRDVAAEHKLPVKLSGTLSEAEVLLRHSKSSWITVACLCREKSSCFQYASHCSTTFNVLFIWSNYSFYLIWARLMHVRLMSASINGINMGFNFPMFHSIMFPPSGIVLAWAAVFNA